MPSSVYGFYQVPGLSSEAQEVTLTALKAAIPSHEISKFETELCFYVGVENQLTEVEEEILKRIFSRSFEKDKTTKSSHLYRKEKDSTNSIIIEIGPRLNFSTAFSTNAVSICQSIGLKKVERVERSRRYLVEFNAKHHTQTSGLLNKDEEKALVDRLHDRMTECRYVKPIESFEVDVHPEQWYEVDVVGKGKPALEKINKDLGLAFDDWDLEYYSELFKEKVGRNPTSVECFDLAQSNSEHSRHWFFRGRLVIDGKEIDTSLMKMVMKTQETSNNNNVIKFSDNSR